MQLIFAPAESYFKKKMSARKFALHADPFDCTLRLEELDGAVSLTGSYATAQGSCNTLRGMPFVEFVECAGREGAD